MRIAGPGPGASTVALAKMEVLALTMVSNVAVFPVGLEQPETRRAKLRFYVRYVATSLMKIAVVPVTLMS